MLKCEVLAIIEEYVKQKVSVSASPGFTWGRSGNVPSGAYLLNDTVSSNTTGRIVPVTTGLITNAFIATETDNTWEMSIQKRSGAAFIEIGTVSMTSQRIKTASLSIAVTIGDELSISVKSGSCKNPVVGLIIKGSTI